jgi:hypothetical protein
MKRRTPRIAVKIGFKIRVIRGSPLECLRNPEMQVAPVESEDRGRTVKKICRTALRNQELWLIQQNSIIHRQRTAKRRLQPET